MIVINLVINLSNRLRGVTGEPAGVNVGQCLLNDYDH